MPLLSPDGIGQSVLAGTRSESCRAGKWVRKASDDVIGNWYGYLHVICQSLSNLYLISINLILSLSLCRSPYHNRCLIFYFTNRYMLSDILDPAFLRPGRIDRKIEFPPVSILHIPSQKVNIYFLSNKIIGSFYNFFQMSLQRGVNLRAQ